MEPVLVRIIGDRCPCVKGHDMHVQLKISGELYDILGLGSLNSFLYMKKISKTIV